MQEELKTKLIDALMAKACALMELAKLGGTGGFKMQQKGREELGQQAQEDSSQEEQKEQKEGWKDFMAAFASTLNSLKPWLDLSKAGSKGQYAEKDPKKTAQVLWLRCFYHEARSELGQCLKLLRAHEKKAAGGGEVYSSALRIRLRRERVRYFRMMGNARLADWEQANIRSDFPSQCFTSY